ncbi:hypothetical protein NQZ68_012535 [Dissostichus eleginoides]|nr:hypothetical protein NQZ68_012535 [Dissostichus eleginoides]
MQVLTAALLRLVCRVSVREHLAADHLTLSSAPLLQSVRKAAAPVQLSARSPTQAALREAEADSMMRVSGRRDDARFSSVWTGRQKCAPWFSILLLILLILLILRSSDQT